MKNVLFGLILLFLLFPACAMADYVHLYGNFSNLNYNASGAGLNLSYIFDPQYGIGLEYSHPLNDDLSLNGGFVYNSMSNVSWAGTTVGTQGISFPYLNMSRHVYKKDFEMNIGCGINYAMYGSGNASGGLGGQIYFEGIFPTGNQAYILQIGWLFANGSTSVPTTLSSQGIFLRGGYAWQFDIEQVLKDMGDFVQDTQPTQIEPNDSTHNTSCVMQGSLNVARNYSGGIEFSGKIVNNGSHEANNVRVIFTLKDSKGSIIDSQSGYVTTNLSSTLASGEAGSFDCFIPNPADAKSYYYNISWYENGILFNGPRQQ